MLNLYAVKVWHSSGPRHSETIEVRTYNAQRAETLASESYPGRMAAAELILDLMECNSSGTTCFRICPHERTKNGSGYFTAVGGTFCGEVGIAEKPEMAAATSSANAAFSKQSPLFTWKVPITQDLRRPRRAIMRGTHVPRSYMPHVTGKLRRPRNAQPIISMGSRESICIPGSRSNAKGRATLATIARAAHVPAQKWGPAPKAIALLVSSIMACDQASMSRWLTFVRPVSSFKHSPESG